MNKYRLLAYLVAITMVLYPIMPAFATVYADSFIYPMKKYKVVSGFGDDRSGIYHIGEDIMGKAGTPIYAIGNGYVKHIGEHTSFGTVILIEHDLKGKKKTVSLYGHLRITDVEVAEGDFVNKGQKIGYLGNPEENGGWSEHLHFGIRRGAYVNEWVYWGLTRDTAEFDNWYVPTDFITGRKAAGFDPFNLSRIITGAGIGGTAHIRQFSAESEAIKDTSFFAFDETERGGADVAVGNFDKDSNPEIVVGAGPGSKPYVKIFDQNTKELQASFLAFPEGALMGINVSAGDIDGDGIDEVIVGARRGGGAQVRVMKLDGTEVFNKMFPFGHDKNSGLDVASGDVDGDGLDEVIVGSGQGELPKVKIYDNDGTLKDLTITPYPEAFLGGVRVAVGDIDGDGIGEIVTGAGPSGGPHVRTFEGDGTPLKFNFFPFHPLYRGGVDVSTTDMDNDGKEEIITAQMSQGQSWIKIYRFNSARTILANFMAYGPNFEGGTSVAGIR